MGFLLELGPKGNLVSDHLVDLCSHAAFAKHAGGQGKMMAILAIVGFAAVLFTYLGVNYLPGLHSYLQS
jgi:ABC-type transport system involved in cytochrome c biogenesis permease subunit